MAYRRQRRRSTTSSFGLVGVSANTTSALGGGFDDLRTGGLDHGNPNGHKVFGRIPAHLVVAVGGQRQHRPGFGQRAQRRGDGGHAGAEHQRPARALQFRER